MSLRAVRDFIILRPAFTGRNISSIGLVAIFFFVYVAAGGKITTVPKIKAGADFGAVSNSDTSIPKKDIKATSKKVPETASRESASSRVSELFKSSKSATQKTTPTEVKKTSTSEENAAKPAKSLDDIEARLRQLRGK